MRIWIARLMIVVALGVGLWGVSDILAIFAVEAVEAGKAVPRVLFVTGVIKLIVAVIVGTLAIKRG